MRARSTSRRACRSSPPISTSSRSRPRATRSTRRRSRPTSRDERLRALLRQGAPRLPRAPRDARDGAVRGARPAEGLAVLAPRPDLLPQPADLPDPRSAGAGARHLPLRAAPGRPAVPRLVGIASTRRARCSRCSTRRTGSSASVRCRAAKLPVPTGPEHARHWAAPRRRREPPDRRQRCFELERAAGAAGGDRRGLRTTCRVLGASCTSGCSSSLHRRRCSSTRDHDIVHLSESAGRFLQFSGGEPTQNLLRADRIRALRIELRAALFQAAAIGARRTSSGRRPSNWTVSRPGHIRVARGGDVGARLLARRHRRERPRADDEAAVQSNVAAAASGDASTSTASSSG